MKFGKVTENQYLCSANQKTKIMLQNKGTNYISEIQMFFSSTEKAMENIFSLLKSLKFSDRNFGFSKAKNLKYSSHSKLITLILFPFYNINDAWSYSQSTAYQYLKCGKDVFYRLLNDANINWRNFAYSLTSQLIKQTNEKSNVEQTQPRCLIVDDTDLPKKGLCMELIGKIYSHVDMTYKTGFKGLFLAFHDGASLFGLDFTLHGEKGKNAKKPYGLTPKQTKARYNKKRDKDAASMSRITEYFETKIQAMMSMITIAIKKGIKFDYLLVDSWFTCWELVKFIKKRRVNCNLIGMVKMGNTKYIVGDKSLTAKVIVEKLKSQKKIRKSKVNGYFFGEIDVDFKGIAVKLFFCKASRTGNWNGFLSTNTDLTFDQAFKIYAIRWSIEVFFKECKQHLKLGKCQSQNFDALVASTTLSMLQYNILSTVKRFTNYETLGAIFHNAQKDTVESTVNQKVWVLIVSALRTLLEIFPIDLEMLMEKLFTDNQELGKILNLKTLAITGEN